MSEQNQIDGKTARRAIMIVMMVIMTAIALLMWGCPKYKVYNQKMAGEAILAHAQASREVAVAEAKAKMESADFLAQAEVKRAEGVAKANKIIGDSLSNNEAYLRYLFINNLAENPQQVIYIPTEAGLPILEAGARVAPGAK